MKRSGGRIRPTAPLRLPVLVRPEPSFPDLRQPFMESDTPGLVAIGGELTPERLLSAYRLGIFPWTVHPVTWWSPDPRGILELDGFHVSRSLSRTLRKRGFRFTMDRAFPQVIVGCAAPGPGRASTWISREFIDAYIELHRLGIAHSVECWLGDELAGGIYGVAVGGLFAGESMFHRVPDGSKAALFHLVQVLKQAGFVLFDIQTTTPITRQLGATEIPRSEYLRRLAAAVALPPPALPLEPGMGQPPSVTAAQHP